MNNRRNFLHGAGLAGLGLLTSGQSAAAQEPAAPINADLPKDIKVTDVKALVYKKGYDRCLFVRIETNTGHVGWGECSPNGIYVIQKLVQDLLVKYVMGQDPFDTERLYEQMFWRNHDLGAGGALTYAIAGVDCALWDLKGKILNVPIYKMIGGKLRDKVKAYGGFGVKGGNIPIKDAIKSALRLAKNGFQVIKIRSQIREYNINPKNDPSIKYYKAIRKELPKEVDLFVDPNEGYTAYRAIQVGKELQDLGMKLYEAPCPNENMEDTAKVVEALDIPVATGEKCYNRWMFKDLIEKANPDIINPDFNKSGGITEGIKICNLASVFFKQVIPHNTKPMLGSAPTIHILCAIPNCGPLIEYIDATRYKGVCEMFEKGIEFKDGHMLLPEGPGLGMVLDEKLAKKRLGY